MLLGGDGEMPVLREVGPGQRHRGGAESEQWRDEAGPRHGAVLGFEAVPEFAKVMVEYFIGHAFAFQHDEAVEVEREFFDAGLAVFL